MPVHSVGLQALDKTEPLILLGSPATRIRGFHCSRLKPTLRGAGAGRASRFLLLRGRIRLRPGSPKLGDGILVWPRFLARTPWNCSFFCSHLKPPLSGLLTSLCCCRAQLLLIIAEGSLSPALRGNQVRGRNWAGPLLTRSLRRAAALLLCARLALHLDACNAASHGPLDLNRGLHLRRLDLSLPPVYSVSLQALHQAEPLIVFGVSAPRTRGFLCSRLKPTLRGDLTRTGSRFRIAALHLLLWCGAFVAGLLFALILPFSGQPPDSIGEAAPQFPPHGLRRRRLRLCLRLRPSSPKLGDG
eukprot:Hpha_TRINITY_DN14539_c0_g1::TRINITY_DN14539_c0_g1_i4::g.46986::m.46986